MIWLLLILFVPSGLNYIHATDILYKEFKPCDDTNITAQIYRHQLSEKKQYYLLIPIPAEAQRLNLNFDTSVSIKLIQPGRRIFLLDISYGRVEMRFRKEHSDKLLNCTVLRQRGSTIPYIRNIVLDEHELCKNPKTGYFDNINEQMNTTDLASTTENSNALRQSSAMPTTDKILFDKKWYLSNAGWLNSFFMSNETKEIIDKLPNTTEEKTNAPDDVFSTTSNPKWILQEQTCGKPKALHTELIVHGQSTKSGHWPWHAAILRIQKFSFQFICGGTLLSQIFVLTAAHCASIRSSAVVPEALRVGLGKLHIFGADERTQEREVFRVIINPKFDGITLDNDIALLKLSSEVHFTDYVQPACLWYKEANNKLPDNIFGTVVGWGFNHLDTQSSTLQKTTIPIVPELTCLKSNPTFFHQRLNDHKFCAGFANGTAVCNGDSGGGLMVFVPDAPGTASGAWYVRGIVSFAPSRRDEAICDPYEYTIFTDVEKYRDWVLQYMD